MARTAQQMPTRSSPFDLAAALRVCGAAGWDAEDTTRRAVACSGVIALLGLPFLMLASVALDAPLAAPAAIAVGYLAMSHAPIFRGNGNAAVNALVPAGLVVWLLAFMISQDRLSEAGLAAALMAPFFAAVPAMARVALPLRADAALSVARERTACLDTLAPHEEVLVVRRDGTLLAATRAAQASLRLSETAIGADVGRCFRLLDKPKLSDAIARCPAGDASMEMSLCGEAFSARDARSYTAKLSSTEGDVISIRLLPVETHRDSAAMTEQSALGGAASDDAAIAERAACDVGEALAFVARRSKGALHSSGNELQLSVEDDLFARCEPQTVRRILHLMIDGALAEGAAANTLAISARALKGVVLLRLTCAKDGERPTAERARLSALADAADAAGGSLVVDDLPEELRLSVRLERLKAPDAEPTCRAGAGILTRGLETECT